MTTPPYLYDLDDRLPPHYALLYGVQWAFIMFPALIIAATLSGKALGLTLEGEVRFLQLTLLTSGLFTIIQTLWGHRYPLLEGPATALVLTFILLAPQGIAAIQGGMILGGALLMIAVFSNQLDRILRLFTPNVIGVILMLIAFGLLPPLIRFMTGDDGSRGVGEGRTFLISISLVLLIAALSFRLRGIWKTLSILIGMIAGSILFLIMGRLPYEALGEAYWVSFPSQWIGSLPSFRWPAVFAFSAAYVAVMVNSLGSLQGIAAVTDSGRLPGSIRRGILLNGVSGMFCGWFGVVGTVTYSSSPGVILVNRIASRFAITSCGLILLGAAFFPKLAALLALVPVPVVGAALCVAMGGQIGVGISMVSSKKMSSRDYFVVGIPLLIGTLVGFLPQGLFDERLALLKIFLENGLIVGISLVLLLEHLLLGGKDH
jgi:xanthine/uracil permease